ncbi:ABC-type cobalt transport system, permease component CbiQ and related transporters [Weissella oryzae SG25]|uniref:Energy-coupling factor transporter transmembrane protein EcfT n=1 Tax=Weissella oryzae (strain DSM 25784 / JCM 18191 / LMG 30913 / SG25) TaxID=1329250 RepID=A0A069CRW8_WEIOS|nr:energy-coupling factor transporter transmembrane component T [Weissella oryzae]GAK29933.1 ABC-type cobalt transport system, permease component CbiQ and related transporters [Weissella oryzae SG25]
MFTNMLIGRYMPGDSWVHRLDARAKLILSVLFVFAVFMAHSLLGYVIATAFALLVVRLTGISIRVFARGLQPLLWLMLFTIALQILFIRTGHVWLHWGVLAVTSDGVVNGLAIFVRFTLIIFFSTVLTLTTPPLEVADALEAVMQPLKKLKVPVDDIALMVSIALRFVPTLMDEAQTIMNAQRARGVEFNEGNIVKRVKAYVPLLIPLFVNAIKRAIELGDAMEARGYRGNISRTKYRVLTWQGRDNLAVIGFLAFVILLLLVRFLGW